MKVVLQRVTNASVHINNVVKAAIGKGILVLVGFEPEDSQADIDWITAKICNLRIFDDTEGIMNLNINQILGDLLVVSQFTLHASTKKGNRPSYIKAAKPQIAVPLYEAFVNQLKNELDGTVETGTFGADMQIELTNDGPVTIIIDSKNKV